MNIQPRYDAALFENRFWLQILGDHARIIFFTLAPTESEYILIAQQFIIQFDGLLERIHQSPSDKELEALMQEAHDAALKLKEFKLELLRMSLNSDLQSHLSPSYYNNMVNELEEFLQVLKLLLANQPLLLHPLHYHLIWLSDAACHASFLLAGLDPAEREEQEHVLNFMGQFQRLYLKALTMNGYLRTGLDTFPSLTLLNNQTARVTEEYAEYLDKLTDQRADNKILGSFLPLIPDHMAREACYYLNKLSQITSSIHRPDCDPTRPRHGT